MERHQPFHWVAKFYDIIHSRGGFDVVIGNPPYVNVRNVDYLDHPSQIRKFPDIYADILLKTIDISTSRGRLGMIVPLSITFSGDFVDLRAALVKRGESWFSSFDNIPAAVFAGVSQRCTIALSAVGKEPQVYMAPMYRWRSVFRPRLMETISYSAASSVAEPIYGLPKVGSDSHIQILSKTLAAVVEKGRASLDVPQHFPLRFAPAARNFISVYINQPPVLDAITLKPTIGKAPGVVNLSSAAVQKAALAGCAGDLFFWYWLVRGDGFDVTGWIVRDFLRFALNIPADAIDALTFLGRLLDYRRIDALVFKKNAGKYVGNYNYRSLASITRRADLILAAGLGLTRPEITGIFDYVQGVLSINEQAREKSIPIELKTRYMSDRRESDVEHDESTIGKVDMSIAKHFGFTDVEIESILNVDNRHELSPEFSLEALI